jgi:hypothetical protein
MKLFKYYSLRVLKKKNYAIAWNLKLRKATQDAESRAKVLEEEKTKIEKSVVEKVAAVEESYGDYRAKVKRDLVALRGAYELALNGIGVKCVPFGDASSLDDFFRWLESNVASLPDTFAGVNKNFMAIALEGVLHTPRSKKCAP